ncbi:MAG: transposase [Haloplasmataceae bacterium]|jgi:transposase-like protein|nr:transposase [Haloplasmataceae bacterium]
MIIPLAQYKFLELIDIQKELATRMITKELREMRFNKDKICPKCSSNHVVKNGKFYDKQRFLCKDCRKTFNDFTATPLSDSKKEFSLRKTTFICGISLPTAFYWRIRF